MRLLCLHAIGTSGRILDQQLAPLKHMIGGDHIWVCVDGPYEHEPHSSVKIRTKGPYFCYHETLSAADQADAHEYLREVMEDEGPFDGILGFSQGASLATSFLLQHKMDHPNDPPPFSFAILFNANLVVSPDQKFQEEEITKEVAKAQQAKKSEGGGLRVKKPFSKTNATNKPELKSISKHKVPGKKSEVANEVLGLLNLSIDAAEAEGWVDRATAFEGKTADDFPRIVHPLMVDDRITVPTTIIVGKGDPLFLCSLVQKRLCTKGSRKFVEHAGGHEIPNSGPALELAAAGCKWAIKMAQMGKMGGGAF